MNSSENLATPGRFRFYMKPSLRPWCCFPARGAALLGSASAALVASLAPPGFLAEVYVFLNLQDSF